MRRAVGSAQYTAPQPPHKAGSRRRLRVAAGDASAFLYPLFLGPNIFFLPSALLCAFLRVKHFAYLLKTSSCRRRRIMRARRNSEAQMT